MNQYGNIVFLNGLTSTGKTSIVNELISRKSHMFFALGFDLFEETIPPWAADQSAAYSQAIIAMYHAARSFSQQGQDVIIDGLIMNIQGLEQHYLTLQSIFAGYPLHIVSVHCPLELCRQRNLLRPDRRENQSLEQSKVAETNIGYSFSINTAKNTVQECVDLLLANVNIRTIR